MYEKSCTHLTEGSVPEPQSEACEQCLKLGQQAVQLRICRTCGHVGCCGQHPGPARDSPLPRDRSCHDAVF